MTKRTTVSMPLEVWEKGEQRWKQHWKFADFSQYVQALIRADSKFYPEISSDAMAAMQLFFDSVAQRQKKSVKR